MFDRLSDHNLAITLEQVMMRSWTVFILQDADKKGLVTITDDIKALAGKARSNTLKPNDYEVCESHQFFLWLSCGCIVCPQIQSQASRMSFFKYVFTTFSKSQIKNKKTCFTTWIWNLLYQELEPANIVCIQLLCREGHLRFQIWDHLVSNNFVPL